VPPKIGKAADTLVSALQAPTTFLFFNCIKQKNTPKTNQQSQTDHGKITTKPLNARLKNWNGMNNVIIPLFNQT
jgi:hypothetical protein